VKILSDEMNTSFAKNTRILKLQQALKQINLILPWNAGESSGSDLMKLFLISNF
jgi:hypothetical protein